MKKDDNIYLFHIRDSINLIIEYTSNINFEDFSNKRMVQDAVTKQFEIIGEASSRLSEDFKDKHNHIPWKKIIGMRNKLIHDYLGVDVKVIWATVTQDISIFRKDILKIIEDSAPQLPLK